MGNVPKVNCFVRVGCIDRCNEQPVISLQCLHLASLEVAPGLVAGRERQTDLRRHAAVPSWPPRPSSRWIAQSLAASIKPIFAW
eukprot:7323138-Pyramimonas_sp.AAC.1